MAVTRRQIIYSGLAIGGGLIVYSVSRVLDTGGDGDARLKFTESTPDQIGLNAWVKIATDGQITFAVHRAEMGQGVTTSLPMMLAEELDADWDMVRYEFPPPDKDYYNFGVMGRGRPFGDKQDEWYGKLGTSLLRRVFHARGDSLTLSSTSVVDAYDSLRPAGAAARAMLIAAAAQRWGVDAEGLHTEKSQVIDAATGKALGYGELADEASRVRFSGTPAPKDPANYSIVGTSPARLDIPEKVDGSAVYGTDVVLPDMLYATVVHSPITGGRITAVDASVADSMPGVEMVVPLGDVAVAVVAIDTWTAMQAAEQLRLTAEVDTEPVNTDALRDAYKDALNAPEPAIFRDDGQTSAALEEAPGYSALYGWPFLAHACMEPMNGTAHFDPDEGRLHIWVGTQALNLAQQMAASSAGLETDQVVIHRTLLGGGFGRRAEMDFVERVSATAMRIPGRPLRMIYSREQDIRHDMYRPAGAARAQARLNDDGTIHALDFTLATQSVVASYAKRTPSPRPSDASRDKTVSTGVYNLFYSAPNMRVAFVPQDHHIPVGYWRSTSTSYGAFLVESFMDELAHSAGMDPVEFRLKNLPADSRHRKVLEAAANRADWGTDLGPGRGRGVAVFEKALTVIAQVADITVAADGKLSIDRIVCVVDPGQLIHPDTVIAMMEGGINFGVNAALNGEITFQDGMAQQGNFNNYRELPMGELPEVEVHLLPLGGRPEGVGETAVPGVAPAIANAIFAATGKRIRTLPIGQRIT